MKKKYSTLLSFALAICLLMMVSCAKKINDNSVRLVELDNQGQIMPGVPAIEGGCYADIGNNYTINKLTFINGDCVIEMSKNPEDEITPIPE